MSKAVMVKEDNGVNKKDLGRCLLRWVFTRQSAFNFETMSSGGWTYSIHPALEKIYGGDAEVIAEKEKEHFKFYNTHPLMGCILLGACIAIESTKQKDATKQAVELRTALMGPMAGIGDSMLWMLFSTILGAIAAYMAVEGSAIGFIIAESVQMALFFIFNRLFYVAFKKGVGFVTTNKTRLNYIAAAASVVGLAVVGTLIATNLNVSFALTMTYGEITQSVNDLLNGVLPKIGNVIAVALIYWGLGRKKMSSGKMVIIVLIASILLSAAGILA